MSFELSRTDGRTNGRTDLEFVDNVAYDTDCQPVVEQDKRADRRTDA